MIREGVHRDIGVLTCNRRATTHCMVAAGRAKKVGGGCELTIVTKTLTEEGYCPMYERTREHVASTRKNNKDKANLVLC